MLYIAFVTLTDKKESHGIDEKESHSRDEKGNYSGDKNII